MAPKSGQKGPLWVPKWVLPGTMFLGVPGRTPKWSQMVPKWCPNGPQGEAKDLQSEPKDVQRGSNVSSESAVAVAVAVVVAMAG